VIYYDAGVGSEYDCQSARDQSSIRLEIT